MELFSEIYSAYYSVVSEILKKKISDKKDIKAVIEKYGFSDTEFFIMPKLMDNDTWRFVNYKDKQFFSKLKNIPFMPLTLIEKSWIKSILNDERALLFLDKSDIERIREKFNGIETLFENSHYHYFDMHNDGDAFSDEKYIKHFRIILEAIKTRRIIKITFNSGKGTRITHHFIPFRIEFSAKNDKFRVFAAQVKGEHTVRIYTINLARIADIELTDKFYPQKADINRLFRYRRCDEPIKLKVFPERNGVERFMMEFAGYEKHTEFDENTGICNAVLYYDKQDETELLIKLLSFGAIIKVESPDDFVSEMKARIERQVELLKQND